MSQKSLTAPVHEILKAFNLSEEITDVKPHGNGHINDTSLVHTKDSHTSYILQKINTSIFQQPDRLMENIQKVTGWIHEKVVSEGGDSRREVLHVIPTADQKSYLRTADHSYYRLYRFIDGVCLDLPRNETDFYESGVAFGKFQGYLSDFPVNELHDTIPDFHNTGKRFENLLKAIDADAAGRAAEAADEIDFALFRKASVEDVMEAKKSLPIRVTHNDTKLNNVMLDPVTGKALCILDLDTVMAGYAMDDFGDSIRFGASSALEDEADLSRVWMKLDLFAAFAKGFLSASKDKLTPEEIRLFPLGARMMTYECGIRFLTDYLQGDVYFKVAYPQHNLVRARNQFALVRDMEQKMEAMQQIILNEIK